MDLIDRYLVAVRRHLPRPQQDDIISELSDSLRSEAEDRAGEMGRALTETEQAELLKKRGHPWLMASRYQPQQQLIGPALYPYYRQALVMVVFWVVLPMTLIGGGINAIYADNSAELWARVLNAAWNGAIYSVGIVTLVFAVLEREQVRFTALENWNPARLPTGTDGRAVPRSETIIGLVFAMTFLVWWTDLVRVPNFMSFDGTPVTFTPAPILVELYVPILFALVWAIAIHLIDLVRPWRTLAVSIADIALGLYSVGIAIAILRAGQIVDVGGDPQFADRLLPLERLINNIVQGTFIVIGAVSVFEILYEVWTISKARPRLVV